LIRAAAFVLILLAVATPAEAQRRPGARADEYDELFKKYSKRCFGPAFEWRLFKAQAMAESNLAPTAQSRVGARGLMQLMPTTFREIQTRNPELECIDHPEWNIAAGIHYDRVLWNLWSEHPTLEDRRNFMLGSYNAGRGTLLRAQATAREKRLDTGAWRSIAEVAPSVRGWRYRETLGYVTKIEAFLAGLKGEETPGKAERP
jgi:membrane-bound lytic murein transglycosylase F